MSLDICKLLLPRPLEGFGQPSELLLSTSGFLCILQCGTPVLAMPLKDGISDWINGFPYYV